MVLLLNCLWWQCCSQAALTNFLVYFFTKFVFASTHVGKIEHWAGQTATQHLGPPKHLLFHHLKKSFSVDRGDVYLCLEPTHFVRPRHRFTNQTVRPKLHQRFVDCIENAFVKNKDWLSLWRLVLICEPFALDKGFLSGLLNFEVKVYRNNWIFCEVQSGFKMHIASKLWNLHLHKCISRLSYDRLG